MPSRLAMKRLSSKRRAQQSEPRENQSTLRLAFLSLTLRITFRICANDAFYSSKSALSLTHSLSYTHAITAGSLEDLASALGSIKFTRTVWMLQGMTVVFV